MTIKAKKLICSICGQEQNLTLDNEIECLKCGYIRKVKKSDFSFEVE
jgi:DNA-directed RNA polymerase subunit RPC12/RpoP